MKRIVFFIITFLSVGAARSQWTTSGNNIYYNNSTGYTGVGLGSPAYQFHIQGKGSGSGTRALYVQNSSGTQTFSVGDDGTTYMPWASVSNDLSVNSSAGGTFHIRSGGSTSSAFTMYGAGGNNGSNYASVGNDSFYIGFDTRAGHAPLRFVNSNTSHDAFDIFSNGNLGVNTNNVDNGNLFQVNGNLWTTGFKLPTGAAAGKVLTSDASGNATWQTAGSGSGWALNGNTDGVVKTIGTLDNYDFPIVTNNLERLRVTSSGSVAIGTINPHGYMLAVNGSAIFTAAWVMPNGNWPDYVFQPDYRLPGLDSVSRYIQLNKHLPDMPSAETVAKAGIDLGGNQTALLRTVEELTLYLIDQDKTIQDYKQKLADQQRQLDDQQRRLERLEKTLNK
jgi:hypothetical protein